MDSLKDRIENALSQLRPFLEADRGDITLVEVTEDMTVHVELHGACRDCSMSYMTLKAGVEQSIMKVAPEVKAVEAINMMNAEG